MVHQPTEETKSASGILVIACPNETGLSIEHCGRPLAVHQQRRWLLTPATHCFRRRRVVVRALEDASTLLDALLTPLRVAMTRNAQTASAPLPGRRPERPTWWNGSRTLFRRKLGVRPPTKVPTPREINLLPGNVVN